MRQVYKDTAEQVECAEASGFDIIWFPEHHFTHHYCAPNPQLNIVDLVRVTRRVKLGTSVIACGMDEFIAVMDFGRPQRDILRSIELFGTHCRS